MEDRDGQIIETHSISAGLDYPGVGPEHAFLHTIGRVRYEYAGDIDALNALDECCELEGILPALEPAHAIYALTDLLAGDGIEAASDGDIILLGLSGRGDKDIAAVEDRLMAGRSRGLALSAGLRTHLWGVPGGRWRTAQGRWTVTPVLSCTRPINAPIVTSSPRPRGYADGVLLIGEGVSVMVTLPKGKDTSENWGHYILTRV